MDVNFSHPFENLVITSTLITMDRGIASSTVLAFLCFHLLLFTISYARNPFDSTLIDVIDHVNHDPLSVYENNLAQDDPNSILIPTDKPEPEPATLIHLEPEPETTNSKTPEPKPETVDSITNVPKETSKAADPNVAFTSSTFRPIDSRVIPRRPLPLTFRVGHRCHRHHHHHRNHHYKQWKPRLPRCEVLRRDDVTLNSVELDKELDRVARDWARQLPAELMRLHHVEPMFSRERNMALDRNELWKRLYRRHYRHEPRNKDTGLMKRIRKFLNHF